MAGRIAKFLADTNARRRIKRIRSNPDLGPRFDRLTAADQRQVLELRGIDARNRIYELDAARRSKVALRSKIRRLTPKLQTSGRQVQASGTLSADLARDQLFRKMQEAFSSNIKWNAISTNARIESMSDEQVFALVDATPGDLRTLASNQSPGMDWSLTGDRDINALWYH